MALEHEALTERIIGVAIEVHRRLGPGFLESVTEKALIIERIGSMDCCSISPKQRSNPNA